jgi:hypothetical protein
VQHEIRQERSFIDSEYPNPVPEDKVSCPARAAPKTVNNNFNRINRIYGIIEQYSSDKHADSTFFFSIPLNRRRLT